MRSPSFFSKSVVKTAGMNGGKDLINVTAQQTQCMRNTGRPLVRCLEHGLPEALQTHEMVVDGPSHSILATQMEEGRLIKLKYNPRTGEIDSKVSFVHMDMGSISAGTNAETGEDLPFVGMHGLSKSDMFPGHVWLTLQYANRICLVDIATLQVQAVITCPRDLPNDLGTVGGPHCVIEANGKLYACMKGGYSCHGVEVERDSAEEATSQGIFRVEVDPQTGEAVPETGVLFQVPPTPVMAAVDGDDNCWVVTDQTNSITKIPKGATSSKDVINIKLGIHYAYLSQSGPGLTIGPDGNPWFCILNGSGLIGKVYRNTHKVVIFELDTSEWNPTPRMCHLSFCPSSNDLYAISSDLLDKSAINSLIRVRFDKYYEQVKNQHELAFPTQASMVHRIAHVNFGDVKEPSVIISELAKSQITQIFKSTLPNLKEFPAKTYKAEIRKVYDPSKPCPMTGAPICSCDFTSDFPPYDDTPPALNDDAPALN